jgi:hypothetical protein
VDVFDNVELEKKVAGFEKALKDRQMRDLAEVAATPEGRRFLYRLIFVECRFEVSPFSMNPQVMANLAGRREVGLGFYKALKALDLNLIPRMEREAANDELLRKAARERIEKDSGGETDE